MQSFFAARVAAEMTMGFHHSLGMLGIQVWSGSHAY
jgi:hypothetical protein